MKPKLILTALIFSSVYLKASPLAQLTEGLAEMSSNVAPGIIDSNKVRKDTTDATGRYTNSVGSRDTNDIEENDTAQPVYKKKDKRGVFSITLGWQNVYQYLGSYYIPKFNYAYMEVRYKFWFGLFGAIAPQFFFNKDSFYYVGTNLTLGFDNEWFRNFHVSFSYNYCAHGENAVEELQDIFGNDFDVSVYYANKIITPEVRYDLTFGVVSGISLSDLSSPGRIKVLGGDNVINAGLSHSFIIFHDKPAGELSIKIGDYVNLGTANALLTRRVTEPADNSAGYDYVDVPYTGDKFSALNDEANLAVYYTWRSISIGPYLNLSVPFRNIAAEQAALGPVNVNGTIETPTPDIVTTTFFYGGVSLIFKFPAHPR